MPRSAAHRHRGLGRRRQVDADRPPAARLQAAARRPGRGRPRARHRRPARRARAGHHDRRRVPVLRHAAALVHPRRHARPRPLHAQHGHRRVDRRPRAGADRRAQGAARAVAAARVPGGAARDPAPRGVREQDGPRRLRRGALPRDRGGVRARSARSSGIADVRAVPISALEGDNVVDASPRLAWYDAPAAARAARDASRSTATATSTTCASRCSGRSATATTAATRGGVAGGVLAVGDEVVVLPSGSRSRVAAIDTPGGPVERAVPPMVATLRLADELDVGRGDLVVGAERRAGGRARARRHRLLDGRGARPRRRALPAQAHDPPRAGEHRGDLGARGHRRPSRRQPTDELGPQRHRAHQAAHRGARAGRPLRRQPRDGRVHPDRRAHARHRRRRDGRGRARGRRRASSSTRPTSAGTRARSSAPCAGRRPASAARRSG